MVGMNGEINWFNESISKILSDNKLMEKIIVQEVGYKKLIIGDETVQLFDNKGKLGIINERRNKKDIK